MKKIVIEGINAMEGFMKLLKKTTCTQHLVFENIKQEEDIVEIVYDNQELLTENYLIINIDSHMSFNLPKYKGYKVITVGFNPKASVTVSSVEDEEMVLCIQREIVTLQRIILPQEYVIKNAIVEDDNTVIHCMTILSMLLIIEKDLLESNNYF
jgi:hypothetical protein